MESSRTWALCMKNPGHSGFIPYPEFGPEHLPCGWPTPEKMEVLRIIAEITVRLRVSYTSLGRPEGFAFHNLRGTNIVHTGSGWIYDVHSSEEHPCPCSQCAVSSSPHRTWMEIVVATACHVIYNSEEARSTSIDFFYDDEESRRNGKMKTVLGSEVILVDTADDTCLLRCVTHDVTICERLLNVRAAAVKIFVGRSCLEDWRPTLGNVCVIISHPHGRPKQVTVGQVKATEEADGEINKLTYSASTCPGSSGALILPMDDVGSARPARSTVHSLGGVQEGFNQSSSVFHHYRPRYDELFCGETDKYQ